jgi:hypothetical protein
MIELTGRACLLLETMQPCRIRRESVGDQLDGDVASETRISRAVHDTHATGPKPPDDFVRTDKGAIRQRRGTVSILHEQRANPNCIAIGNRSLSYSVRYVSI